MARYFPRFVYHNKLDSRIWNRDKTLKPLVEIALTLATDACMQKFAQAGFPIKDSDVMDVVIGGSAANYYYDNTSDIDIYLCLDMTKLQHMAPDFDWQYILRSQKDMWIEREKIRICGRRIDFTIIDGNDPIHANGIFKSGQLYSIPQSKWTRCTEPLSKSEIKQLKHDAWKKFKLWRRICRQIFADKKSSSFASEFCARIYRERNQSLDVNILRAITPTACAFRMLRQIGYWTRLKKYVATYNTIKDEQNETV